MIPVGRLLSVSVLLSFVLFAGTGIALAADGSIQVTVLEVIGGEGEEPLVGAQVTLSHGEQLIQAVAQYTDVNGQVVFPAVPAGSGYVVTASMPSYGSVERDQVAVIAGKTSPVVIALTEELTEQVEVKGRRDVVDLEEGAQTSTVITDDFFADLPVLGREYQNVLSLAPGVNDSDGDGNPNVHGARDRDFQLTIEGVSNVDPLTGKFMSFITPDAIAEIEVIDSGADASFGGAVGGFGRIKIKDGGNEFEGSFNLFFRDSTFDNDLDGNRDPLDYGLFQPSVFFSGPIVKDNVWFVVNHEYLDYEFPIDFISGPDFTQSQKSVRSLDKITWIVDSRQNKLQLQYSADPIEIKPFDVSSLVPPDSGSIYELGGPTLSLKWTAPYSPTLFWEATVARSEPTRDLRPFNRDAANDCVIPRPFADEEYLRFLQCSNTDLGGRRSGTYFLDYEDTRQRWTYNIDGEKFLNEWLGGSHRVKFGFKLERVLFQRDAEYRDQLSRASVGNPFGSQLSGGNDSAARLTRFVYAPKVNPFDISSPTLINDESRGNYLALYLTDTYNPLDNLSISVGLRFSREELEGTGFVPFDPAVERASYDEFIDGCLSNPFNTVTTCISQLGGIENFTIHQLDRPSVDEFGQPIGCISDDIVNTLQCQLVEQNLISGSGDIMFRSPTTFGITNNNVEPRISVSWDPNNDAKTKLFGSFNRYYGNTILLPFLFENGPDFATKVLDINEQGQIITAGSAVASAFQIDVVDRNLKAQHTDEYALGFEREIAPETSIRVRYLNRTTYDQLQDVDVNHKGVLWDDVKDLGLLPDGRSVADQRRGCRRIDIGGTLFADCYGNLQFQGRVPGPGLPPRTSGTIIGAPDGRPDLVSVSPFFSNIFVVGNRNDSEYEAYILELTRRFYQNWEFQGSYVYSKAVGDAEDFFQALGDDVTNAEDEKGYLAYDQRHIVRLNGRMFVPRWGGFRLGGAFIYQTGLPYSIVETRDVLDFPTLLNQGASGTVYGPPAFFQVSTSRTFFPTGRRNDQRNKPTWTLNTNIQKEFSIRNVRATFQFDIFNLLGDDTLQIFLVRRIRSFDAATGEQITVDFPVAGRRLGRQFQLGFKVNF